MKNLISFLGISGLVFAGCGYDGADAANASPTAKDNDQTQPVIIPAAGETKPAVSLSVGSDRTVEFYELANGATFLSETGPAGSDLALDNLDSAVDQSDFVAVHQALRPDLEVPENLIAIQARRLNDPLRNDDAGLPASMKSLGAPIAKQAQASSDTFPSPAEPCSNGCCYAPWLTTVCGMNQGGGYTYWFLLDYIYSSAWGSGMTYYRDMVCASIGTSTWTGYQCHGGFSNGCMEISLTVEEAHYRTISDSQNSIWGNASFRSDVNSAANQHLHTHCGFGSF